MKNKLGALLALVAFLMYLLTYLIMVALRIAGKGSGLNPETVLWRGTVIIVVFWIFGRFVGNIASRVFTESESERSVKRLLLKSRMWTPELAEEERTPKEK